jgi:hypothetical protein
MFSVGDFVVCGCCGEQGEIEELSAGRYWVRFNTYRMFMFGGMLRRAT